MLKIVAGIGDNSQPVGWQNAIKPKREFGAANATRQGQYRTIEAHRKRSCSGGRTSAAASASGAVQWRPRTSTIGIASFAWPITSEAAAAISSAKPVSV